MVGASGKAYSVLQTNEPTPFPPRKTRKLLSIAERTSVTFEGTKSRRISLRVHLNHTFKWISSSSSSCSRKDCRKLLQSDPSGIINERVKMLSMEGQERKRYLTSMLSTRQVGKLYFIGFGNKVCSRFLTNVFHFSADMQCSVKGTKKAKARNSITRLEPSPRQPEVRENTIAAIRRIARNFGQMMPDKSEVHLPYTGVDQLYNRMADLFKLVSEECGVLVKQPTRPYFFHVFKTCTPNIKTPRIHRFTKCSTCDRLQRSKRGTSDPARERE